MAWSITKYSLLVCIVSKYGEANECYKPNPLGDIRMRFAVGQFFITCDAFKKQ